MDIFRKIIGQKQFKKQKSDFERFIEHIKKGNLQEVMLCFRPDFLERTTYFKRNRPIHHACRRGHLGVVQFLCEANCELDCADWEGYTPMEVARRNGRKKCENYLNEILECRKIFDCARRDNVQAFSALYSTDIFKMEENKAGILLLEAAVQSKANKIINYLLDKLVNDEEISILEDYMKKCSRREAVQLLQECLLYRSIRFHHADGFDLSCNAKTINEHGKLIKSSFLEIAAEFGCKAFIDAILKKSIYNKEEWTKAKDLAIAKGHVRIAETISEREILLRKRAENHFTWLHSAVCDNDSDMVEYIIDRKHVNPNSNNEVVGTALSLAHMMCYKRCIRVLEEFNVDVNTQNKYSQSPLHEAIESGMTDHCSYLISQAKNIDKPGFMGFTCLQCAVIKGSEKLCGELVEKGADCVRYVEILQKTLINKTVSPISKRENAITLCIKIHKTIYPCFLQKLKGDMMKYCDEDGNSLLHMAVKLLEPDLCSTLMKSGSNIKAINARGNSPLFELFSPADNQNDNVEKAITTLNILVKYGIDLNTVSKSGMTVLKGAAQWNSERLMISLLPKQSQVTCVTKTDFKLAFTNQWFKYATTLISIMTKDCSETVITDEIFYLAKPHCDSKLLMSLFMKSTATVQQLVVEDLLDHFALKDEYDNFINLLKIEITKPKLFANGETLLTSLLKKKKLEYCWAIINCTKSKRYIVLTNITKKTPLGISIETDLWDLINPLILNCDDESVLQFNRHDLLIQLFQKLSNSNNNDVDQKLLAAIKTVIYRGGDIYKKSAGGAAIITYCTRFKEIIEAFQNNQRNQKRDDQNICNVCFDKKVNCAFDCGHIFCMDCGEQLFLCPMCNLEVTRRMKLYFN